MAPCLKGWYASLVPDPYCSNKNWPKDNRALQAHPDDKFVYTKNNEFYTDNDFTLTSRLAGSYFHYNST